MPRRKKQAGLGEKQAVEEQTSCETRLGEKLKNRIFTPTKRKEEKSR